MALPPPSPAPYFEGKMDTKCKCGCGLDISADFKDVCESIEQEIGQTLTVLSGARCPTYNATIQGSIAGDAHTLGLAVDVLITDDVNGRTLLAKLLQACFKRGILRHGNGQANHNYWHFDIAKDLPSPRVWCYK